MAEWRKVWIPVVRVRHKSKSAMATDIRCKKTLWCQPAATYGYVGRHSEYEDAVVPTCPIFITPLHLYGS
jgi:hypothetical protein